MTAAVVQILYFLGFVLTSELVEPNGKHWTNSAHSPTNIAMNKIPAAQFEHAKKAGQALNAAAKSLRVLSSVEWSAVHRSRFLNKGTLPKPRYSKVKTSHTRDYIAKARSHIDGEDVVFEWLDRLANTLETTVNLIEARGTPEFFTHSVALYGQPTQFMLDGKTRVIDLARHMDISLTDLDFSKLVMDGVEHQLTSHEFAAELCSGGRLETYSRARVGELYRARRRAALAT